MNNFETMKQHFTGEDEEMQILLPKECGIEDDDDLAIEDRNLTITKYVVCLNALH